MESGVQSASPSDLSLERAAADAGDLPFLRNAQFLMTYADVAEMVRGSAGALALAARGLPRPVVWLRLSTSLDSVLSVLTCIEAGVPFAAAHPRWTEHEAAERMDALTGADFLHLPVHGHRPDPSAIEPVADDAPLAILFTSGTSGVSAPVVLSRGAVVASAAASRSAIALEDSDRWLLSMPLAHVGGLSIVIRCLLARASVVLDTAGFDPLRWISTVRDNAVTHASVVPTMLRRLVEQYPDCPPSLRYLLVGGAACDGALARLAREADFPIRLTYGMTETCSMVACEAAPGQGGVGRGLFGIDVRSVDGELCVRSPTLATGVFSRDGVVRLPLDDDGFFHTGDLGRVEATGIVHVDGRRSDLIVTGGENVHPTEVEAALLAQHGVAGAVVFGVPDGEWGSRVCAAVVIEDPSVTPARIDDVLRGRLAGFKRPKAYALFRSMATLPSGKIDRRAVVEIARGRLLEL